MTDLARDLPAALDLVAALDDAEAFDLDALTARVDALCGPALEGDEYDDDEGDE